MTFISPRDLVTRGAVDYPERIAVTSSEGPITYGELAEQTAMAAATLKEAGVGAGVQVALAISDPVTFFVCYFGVLEAGGIIAPISATATVTEARELITSSGAQFLIVDRDSALPAGLETGSEPSTLPSCDSVVWRMDSGSGRLTLCPGARTAIFFGNSLPGQPVVRNIF